MTEDDTPIAELRVSALRRGVAAGAPAVLGLFLVYVAVGNEDVSPVARALLATLGLGAVFQANTVWKSTARYLILTRSDLRDSAGVVLTPLSAIKSVEAGFFTFKPSNGFLIRLTEPGPTTWVPGLYWRRGTRIGIGGAASGHACRQMAQVIDLARQGEM